MVIFDTAGFHEAVGDTIALSVSTPQHLEKVGLLHNYTDTEEDNINALMQIALQKVRLLRGTDVLAFHIGNAVRIRIRILYAITLLHVRKSGHHELYEEIVFFFGYDVQNFSNFALSDQP
jgi:hypothetical protein